jgi:hypothetical protein
MAQALMTRRMVLAGAALATGPARGAARSGTRLVTFEASAFPYRGVIPGSTTPFLDVTAGERRGHTSPRGGVYWEDPTYADRRVLLSVPPGFDPRRPAVIVLYFHGNRAVLERDVVRRQGIARQVAASRLNAVLVAPQLAVDALDSSAGRFWEEGFARTFLNEAAARLAETFGTGDALRDAPVVVVAYSGGYLPAAFTATVGGLGARLHGLMLMDALYGEIDRFAGYMKSRPRAFVFSAYSRSTKAQNALLGGMLSEAGLTITSHLPAALAAGQIVLHDAGANVVHDDFMTQAWSRDPLRAMLDRVPGFTRR